MVYEWWRPWLLNAWEHLASRDMATAELICHTGKCHICNSIDWDKFHGD